MQKISFLLATLLFVTTFIFSCDTDTIEGSGRDVTLDFDVTDFEKLIVSDDFEVFINFSNDEKVQLKVDEALENRVVVEKTGKTLRIELEGNVNLRGDITQEAYITVPFLDEIEGRSDTKIQFENTLNHSSLFVELSGDSKLEGNITTEDLLIDLSGDSKLEFFDSFSPNKVELFLRSDSEFTASFNTTNFKADLSGDSKVMVSGSTGQADIKATGDSEIEDFDFSIEDLIIDLRSDSKAKLTITKTIDIRASGDSELEYRGNATITAQNLTGDSEVIKID